MTFNSTFSTFGVKFTRIGRYIYWRTQFNNTLGARRPYQMRCYRVPSKEKGGGFIAITQIKNKYNKWVKCGEGLSFSELEEAYQSRKSLL